MAGVRPQQAATAAAHKEFVGENIRLARVTLRLNQAALAEALHISQSRLNQWEAGLYYPDPWALSEWCRSTGLTMDWFYRRVLVGVSAGLAADLRAEVEAAALAL